jgi:hypothetical protein
MNDACGAFFFVHQLEFRREALVDRVSTILPLTRAKLITSSSSHYFLYQGLSFMLCHVYSRQPVMGHWLPYTTSCDICAFRPDTVDFSIAVFMTGLALSFRSCSLGQNLSRDFICFQEEQRGGGVGACGCEAPAWALSVSAGI